MTGLTPVIVHLEHCNACGLCFEACPEPKGLLPLPAERSFHDMVVSDPFTYFGADENGRPAPVTVQRNE